MSRLGAIFDLVFLEGPEDLLTPLFNEAGGHRYMRVPPTERKGRVHTSTVTVAVFEGHLEPQMNTAINPKDILERVTKGAGGLAGRFDVVTGDTLATSLREFVRSTGQPVIEKPFLPGEVRRVVAELGARGSATAAE